MNNIIRKVSILESVEYDIVATIALLRPYYTAKRTREIANFQHSPLITSKMVSICTF